MFTPKFLSLSNDVSEPFVIPDVSPTSPQLKPESPRSSVSDESLKRERAGSVIELH